MIDFVQRPRADDMRAESHQPKEDVALQSGSEEGEIEEVV